MTRVDIEELRKEKQYWDEHLSSRLTDASFDRLARILASDPQVTTGRGLELGCGEGRLMERVPSMLGSDFSVLGLRHATPGLPVVCADASNLPLPQACLNFVATNSLHHMPYREVISEAARVLKPGGSFWCFEPNRWHAANLLRWRSVGAIIPGDRGFFPRRLGKELADVGLAVVEHRYIALDMERQRLLTRVQSTAQRIPVRWVQAWFALHARRVET